MNTVEPIRSLKVLEDMIWRLRVTSDRNYMLFLTGIYTGLRISDILRLKVRDFRNRDYLYLRAKKTGKETKLCINPVLKKEMARYIEGKAPDEWLFPSRVTAGGKARPIGREQAYRIIRDLGRRYGLENIGTHSMRKTFGYHMYKNNHYNLALLQEIYGHKNPADTLRYIGVSREKANEAIRKFRYA